MGLLQNAVNKAAEKLMKKQGREEAGFINGSAFPIKTRVDIDFDLEKDKFDMIFVYSDGKEELITHDMVKCATLLSMGVISVNSNANGGSTLVHGAKYLCVLKDGRQGVLTVDMAHWFAIEKNLF